MHAANVHHADRTRGQFVEHPVTLHPQPPELRLAEGGAVLRARVGTQGGDGVRDERRAFWVVVTQRPECRHCPRQPDDPEVMAQLTP